MTYDEIIKDVSERLELPKGLVDKTYKAYWRAVRKHITSLPLKEDLTDEEFMKLRPNVNIPSIGKFYILLASYRAIRKNYDNNIKLKENKNATYNKD